MAIRIANSALSKRGFLVSILLQYRGLRRLSLYRARCFETNLEAQQRNVVACLLLGRAMLETSHAIAATSDMDLMQTFEMRREEARDASNPNCWRHNCRMVWWLKRSAWLPKLSVRLGVASIALYLIALVVDIQGPNNLNLLHPRGAKIPSGQTLANLMDETRYREARRRAVVSVRRNSTMKLLRRMPQPCFLTQYIHGRCLSGDATRWVEQRLTGQYSK